MKKTALTLSALMMLGASGVFAEETGTADFDFTVSAVNDVTVTELSPDIDPISGASAYDVATLVLNQNSSTGFTVTVESSTGGALTLDGDAVSDDMLDGARCDYTYQLVTEDDDGLGSSISDDSTVEPDPSSRYTLDDTHSYIFDGTTKATEDAEYTLEIYVDQDTGLFAGDFSDQITVTIADNE